MMQIFHSINRWAISLNGTHCGLFDSMQRMPGAFPCTQHFFDEVTCDISVVNATISRQVNWTNKNQGTKLSMWSARTQHEPWVVSWLCDCIMFKMVHVTSICVVELFSRNILWMENDNASVHFSVLFAALITTSCSATVNFHIYQNVCWSIVSSSRKNAVAFTKCWKSDQLVIQKKKKNTILWKFCVEHRPSKHH